VRFLTGDFERGKKDLMMTLIAPENFVMTAALIKQFKKNPHQLLSRSCPTIPGKLINFWI
jgi:hypothetical protein